jgi:hypothetical protein
VLRPAPRDRRVFSRETSAGEQSESKQTCPLRGQSLIRPIAKGAFMRRAILLCAMLMLAVPLLASAEDGYVYGDNHCFYFSAPTGWTADHLSGKSQGLAFVFYPANSSWSKATTVIYARVIDKSKNLKEPKDQVAQTLEQFHKEYESPNSKAEKVGTVKSQSGVVGEIYRFTGDK